MNIDIKYHLEQIDKVIHDAKVGLPEDIFLFISRNTPLINVDLLIKDENNNTLLIWRDDEFYVGWHLPGGIIRFKEYSFNRINAVAKRELDATVEHEETPLTIKELVCDRNNRGHFISMVYKCKLTSQPSEELKCLNIDAPKPSQWAWHNGAPKNLLEQHQVFSEYM